MSTDHAGLDRFLSEDCPECGTPGYQRHLSAVDGCATCVAGDPRPVFTPIRSAGIAPYDLPAPGVIGDSAGWQAWRKAGGNLVTEAGRRVPWPSPSGWQPGCYRLASGSVVHVKPECRC